MFYGASSIPSNNKKSAVGNLIPTAQKYVSLYGPGAMIFIHGCGDQLSYTLWNEHVITLDAQHMISLDIVNDYMKTYCSDKKGDILP